MKEILTIVAIVALTLLFLIINVIGNVKSNDKKEQDIVGPFVFTLVSILIIVSIVLLVLTI